MGHVVKPMNNCCIYGPVGVEGAGDVGHVL